MSIYAAQTQTFYLVGSGATAGNTTITVQSFKDILGTNLSMSSFGAYGYGTIEPDTANEDSIIFTGITQNSNGSATLTGVASVLFIQPYTASAGLRLSHAGSTSFVISNTSAFYSTFANKNNDETITGYFTAPNPVSAQGIATKTYVDNLVNGGAVSTNAVIVSGTAGETIVAGNVVYLKLSDSTWWKSDSGTVATTDGVSLGIVTTGGTAGNSCAVQVLGTVTGLSGLTANTK